MFDECSGSFICGKWRRRSIYYVHGSGSPVVVIRPRVGGFIANVDAESNVQRSSWRRRELARDLVSYRAVMYSTFKERRRRGSSE